MGPEEHPMRRSWSWARLVMAVSASAWAVWAADASAQLARGATRTSPMAQTPGAFTNPYMNPYTNPFLNPYATQYPMSGPDAALSFLAAQQATGGLGSGRLSGVRPSGREGRPPSLPRRRTRRRRSRGPRRRATSIAACPRPAGREATTIGRVLTIRIFVVDGHLGIFPLRLSAVVPN